MTGPVRGIPLRVARIVSLLVLTALGTAVLVRMAPGYFADAREMDAGYSEAARQRLAAEQEKESSFPGTWAAMAAGMLHGEFGQSRQYGMPVAALVMPRLWVTARLLLISTAGGVLLSLACALPCAAMRVPTAQRAVGAVSTLALAVPVGAMATFCLRANCGGAALVLFALVAVRSFRLFSRLLRRHMAAPHLLFARASGVAPGRIVFRHVLQPMRREIATLGTIAFVTALNAAVPVEVIFGVPGVGQLAWGAAMNRDLPVLLAVSVLMALPIGIAALFTEQANAGQAAA